MADADDPDPCDINCEQRPRMGKTLLAVESTRGRGELHVEHGGSRAVEGFGGASSGAGEHDRYGVARRPTGTGNDLMEHVGQARGALAGAAFLQQGPGGRRP